jgi:cysteinyl-tRNA synthetase
MHFAGATLDIHAGGQDLIFPHHENETAQSEAATGKPFSKYWMHNGFLDIEGEKMSKSLGNFLTVRDILKQYDPMAIRMFFILKHYRSPIDFSRERVEEAQAAFNRLKNAHEKITRTLKDHDEFNDSGDTSQMEDFTEIVKLKMAIEESLDDDFNTAKAMGYFFEIARIVNSLDEGNNHAYAVMIQAKEVFEKFGHEIFGLTFEKSVEQQGLVDDLMDLLINIRTEARKEKNFALGDSIRDRLKEIGILLEDRPDGTSWKME